MIIVKSKTFIKWISRLKDQNAAARIGAVLEDWECFGKVPQNIKSLGSNLYEMRFHMGAGYRVYYTVKAGTMYFILAGGDKSSQSRDIAKAREIIRRM